MFRARYLVVPSLMAILMAISTLYRQNWVLFHVTTTGASLGYVTDWTMGLWHICAASHFANCTTQTYSTSCDYGISYNCPKVEDGSLEAFKNLEGDICLSWIAMTRTLLITGVCLHALSQIAIMIEKPGASRNSPKIWTAFGVATTLSGLLELGGMVDYWVKAKNNVQIPQGIDYDVSVNQYTYAMLGVSISTTIILGCGCLARAIYLRCHKPKDPKPCAPATLDPNDSAIRDLRYLVSPSPIRRGSTQGSVILNVNALKKYAYDVDAPPSYSEAVAALMTSPLPSYSTCTSAGSFIPIYNGSDVECPISAPPEDGISLAYDAYAEQSPVSQASGQVRFRVDSVGADDVSVISDSEV